MQSQRPSCDTASANVSWHLALERKAAAETNADFEAAALLYVRDPRRARPSLPWDEKPSTAASAKATSFHLKANATPCCT